MRQERTTMSVVDDLQEQEKEQNHEAGTGKSLASLRNAKAFIFDMDGVLYRGKAPLPGVADVFNALTIRGIGFLLATNNSMATPASYVQRMADMGVTVGASHIQTSSTATRDFLLGDMPEGSVVHTVGMPALRETFEGNPHFKLTEEGAEHADVVVVGLDLEFTYEKLRVASHYIRSGARFVAPNADGTLPNEHGVQPGAGSIVAAIAAASGVQPTIIGKPQTLMMTTGAELLGVQPGEAVMVGDRLDTDIAAGHKAGLTTVLVLTGVTRREDLAGAEVLPDYVFADLPALLTAIVGHG
jgi:4-nitrophenyl phosphatase